MSRSRLSPLAAVLLLLAAPAAPAAGTVDEDLLPGGTVDSTVFPASEVEVYRVAAPAGATLKVDLRPAGKGGFLPSLEATLADGSAAAIPAPAKPGAWKALLPFPVDGVLTLRVGSAAGAGDYRLRTKLRAPRTLLLEGAVEGEAGASLPFHAPPSAVAVVKVSAADGSALVARISGIAAGDVPAEPGTAKPGPRGETWKRVPLPVLGPWTLSVAGADGTTGSFAALLQWKVPRGPREDHRDPSVPGTLDGDYNAWIAGAPGLLPSFLTGNLRFDGKGRIEPSLETAILLPDEGSPLGFTVATLPVEGGPGSYRTDGATAAVSLDPGTGEPLERDFAVAASGTVLHAGLAGGGGDPGLLLRRVAIPAKADLAGSWSYLRFEPGTGGEGSVEAGVLTFSTGGGVSGLGLRTALSFSGGGAVPGEETPILRTGSLAVAADGTVTVTTTENLFGPTSSWTAATVLAADILAGGDGDGAFPAGGGTLFLRQGLGLTDADVAGDYLHAGLLLGAAPALRSGILAFDGSGGFAGPETVTGLAGTGEPQTVETTGTYSVNAQGIATLAFDGGAAGTGVVGPDASYLFTFSVGEEGFGVDLLLDLGE